MAVCPVPMPKNTRPGARRLLHVFSSLLRFRSERNGNSVDQFPGLYHAVCSGPKFLEMRRLQMRLIGILIPIYFKDSDAGGMLFFGHGIEDETPWLYTNRSFRHFLSRDCEAFQLSRVDFKFCYAHVWTLPLLSKGAPAKR